MSNQINSVWTDDRIANLKRLWDIGYSCSQIAAELGYNITRNAVIGKAHRLGLGDHSRSFNANGHARMVDPIPSGTPRASPKPRTRPTVFKSREVMPASEIVNTKPTPGMVQVFSTLTGYPITLPKHRRPRQREMTKDELRNMLTNAVQNTAAMEAT